MLIVVAMDSFKGSLSSVEANAAVARALEGHDVVTVPVSDGGEGFLDAWLAAHPEGEVVTDSVPGLDGVVRQARFGWSESSREAVIELAEVSGLMLVETLDPWRYSTYGTGMQLRAAILRGARRITIGLGGSATIDGGKGLLEALGVRFYDSRGNELWSSPHQIGRVASVDWSNLMLEAREVEWRVVSDVTNPLLGGSGAVAVFGPQKGLAEGDIDRYEAQLARYATCFARDMTTLPGAGAAGGAGFALYQLGATYVSGIEEVVRWTDLEERLRTADGLITGEGKFDQQSLHGKAPYGLARLAHAHGVPTLVFTGQSDMVALPDVGIEAVFSIVSRVMTLEEAMRDAESLLTNAVRRIVRLLDKKA